MSINEELSFTEYTLPEDTTDFIISFDRIGGSTDEVTILVNNTPIEALVGYTVTQVNLSTWQVDPALPAGTVVRLARTTNLDKMVYVFTAGSKFIAKNVDDNFKQIQHSQQEVRDNFSSLEVRTSMRLDSFSDRVANLTSEFLSTQDVVSDLVTISADTVTTANTALNTANAIDAKASTALSNSSTALSTATGIDAKATDALDNSLTAILESSAALNTANAVDGKATQALADAATALSSATTAVNTANAIDAKATQALSDSATALTNSAGALKSSNNLSDVGSATVSRANLGVMSSSEVTTAIANATLPYATESTAGKAKIATTAIAQAGTNDTDFLTPKKLRNALNASGDAPVSACRAWLSVNTVTSTILQSFNIASFVKTTTGQFEITFTTPMPHQNYVAFTNNITVKGGAVASNTVGSTFNATQTNTVSRCYIWCWSTSSGALINPEVLNVGVFC